MEQDSPIQDPRAQILATGRAVIESAASGLTDLARTLDAAFATAADRILRCRGMLVTSGIGKAGHVATKVSATFASTGTPSFFLHPSDAIHGDLGRVGPQDVALLFSNSGGSPELLRLVPPLRGIGATLVSVTAAADSPLAREADVALVYGRQPEAGPLGLAPTTSTTVMQALGDALAMAVLEQRGFSPAEFARYHPGGALGRSLLRVQDVMRRGAANPVVSEERTILEVLDVMSETPGRPGAASVVDAAGRLVGFYTDGDFRRNMKSAVHDKDSSLLCHPVRLHMTRDPRSIGPDRLVAEAVRVLREAHIDQIPVVDAERVPVGLLDVQDLLDIKVIA